MHSTAFIFSVTVEQLFPLYTALLFMLRACLMKELGIPEEKYKEFIANNGQDLRRRKKPM